MKKNILIIIVTFCITITGLFIFLYSKINLELNGESEVVINFGDSYQDDGVIATYNKKSINEKVTIINNIDYNNLGNYYIKYHVCNGFICKSVKRKVQIVDNEKPTIELKGANPCYLYDEKYQEYGYIVKDNYDTNLEVKITGVENIDYNKNGTYLVTYEVLDSSGNKTVVTREVIKSPKIVVKNGITYVKGVLIVNKKYSIPSSYGNGVNSEAYNQLKILQNAAKKVGFNIPLKSGYRSYNHQKTLYNNYVKKHGQKVADTFSAKPGHSEHQTGLAFDVGNVSDNYGETKAGIWLSKNAHLYGFIIRYPKGKQEITGYKYEPWHIRYLGVDLATKVYKSGLCLEEYLEI